MYRFHFNRGVVRAALLALLPMTLAVGGAFIDERAHLGFSNWRSACRSAGLSPGSLATFTLQLLPGAVIGALAGGLLVQIFGLMLRHRGHAAECALAAHGGCLPGMAAGLALCTTALPLPLILAAEGLLAMSAAAWLLRAWQKWPRDASVRPHTRALTSA